MRPRIALALAALAALAVGAAACGDNVHHYQADAAIPFHQGLPPDAGPDAPQAWPVPSGVGAPCTSTAYLGQGTCDDGLLCLTAQMSGGLTQNGYCTLECGGGLACPGDATCVTLTSSSLCLATCADDGDCRTDDGYHCVEKAAGKVCWSWITPPGTRDGGACQERDGGPYVDSPDRLFGASQQLEPPDTSIIEYQASVSATSSWGGGGRLGVSASANGGTSFGPGVFVADSLNSRRSDPVLAVDATGAHLYLAWIGYDRSGGQTSNMRVIVGRSDDGGQTWSTSNMVDASTSDTGTGNLARPWLALGPSGEVYVGYSLALSGGAGSAIKIARSRDDGATWDAPLRVDDGLRATTSHTVPHVATNAAGDVFVAWLEQGGTQPDGDAANDVFVARWDALSTWDAFGANVKANADGDLVVSNGPRVLPSVSGTKVYVVYTAGTPDALRWDIRLTWSDDSGQTFTTSALTLNDDGTCATHLLPAAAIDAADRLHVVWYDNRFGSDQGALFYGSFDPLVGTPAANQLVSDDTFELTTDTRASNRLGSYVGLAVDGTAIYATWADPRGADNTSHIRFAKGTLP
jgi:hypothetical protein